MTERTKEHLDTFRFAPSAESLRYMQELKAELPTIQKDFPEVKGLGFFGSRTLGTDRPDSDLDTFIFYNSADIPKKAAQPRSPMSVLKRPKTDRFEILRDALQKQLAKNNLAHSSLIAIDIEPGTTQAYTTALIEAVANHEIDESPVNNRPDRSTAYMAYLMSRFSLATGHEVYQSRKQVLDYLAKLPDGEKYFQVLMNHLAYAERAKHPQTGLPPLPRTIAEAREYFLTE